MGGEPAKSKEEDINLTRDIIMNHIGSTDDLVVDNSQTDVADSSTTEGAADGEGSQPLKKIKSIGSKIKNKLKSKLEKDE
eukprot:CAMPEP_0172311482 /NCGR_PEP_ID=MMETSP1058-20130122/14813_1 /TAXON_ID=83371 /ORGANISM="Detonula confervacea, Strain CCMP 353" /LENGTH=79 /DNA_ID=CAMNT_0013024661 /DNA_START=332 /DNA_END=571 /DNA_ORIENTATION=+